MTRRTFLLVAAGVTAIGTAVAAVKFRLGPRRLGPHVRRLEGFGLSAAQRLRRHFAWLSLADGTIESYLAEHEVRFGTMGRFARSEPNFYTRFLLSTDFYENGAERPRNGEPVRYVGFYDPDTAACYNPLATPPPSDAELGRAAGRFPG